MILFKTFYEGISNNKVILKTIKVKQLFFNDL